MALYGVFSLFLCPSWAFLLWKFSLMSKLNWSEQQTTKSTNCHSKWRERRLVTWRQLIGYITTHVVEFPRFSFGSAASVSSDETQVFLRLPSQPPLRKNWSLRIDLVTVFDDILTSRQGRKNNNIFPSSLPMRPCARLNLMSNNFRKTAILKKISICKLKLLSKGLH